MKVSVLVPVYGVEKFIERCAVSLFEQTYGDMEYIFVNDCTPDRSIDILRSVVERYPSRRGQVTIVSNERNMGSGFTRERALSMATGDCVMYVDSDDYIPLRAVELLAAKMEQGGADIVDGAWQRKTLKGLEQPVMPWNGGDEKAYLKVMLCQNIVTNQLWARLFRRSLYTSHGITFATGVDMAEDYSVMARLLFFARRTFINDVVYYYSDENPASYTKTMSRRHVISCLRANRIVMDFYAENDPEGHFRTPLDIGLMNTLRIVRENNFSLDEAEKILPVRPKSLVLRAIAALLRSRRLYKVGNVAYRGVRKIKN